MANFKVVISDPASKKAYQKEVEQAPSGLMGKKIGEKVSGSGLGLEGYELEITGGSDSDGFPMRGDIEGPARKKVILTSPPGYKPKDAGKRKRKSVRGNTISQDIAQVNVKVVKAGAKKLEEIMGKKEEKSEVKDAEKAEAKGEKAEAKPAEKPAKKTEQKTPRGEGGQEAPKEEKPAENAEEQSAKAESKMGVKKLEDQEKKTKDME